MKTLSKVNQKFDEWELKLSARKVMGVSVMMWLLFIATVTAVVVISNYFINIRPMV